MDLRHFKLMLLQQAFLDRAKFEKFPAEKMTIWGFGVNRTGSPTMAMRGNQAGFPGGGESRCIRTRFFRSLRTSFGTQFT